MQSHCGKCNYDLAGLPSGPCPECGSSLKTSLPWRQPRWVLFAIGCAPTIVMGSLWLGLVGLGVFGAAGSWSMHFLNLLLVAGAGSAVIGPIFGLHIAGPRESRRYVTNAVALALLAGLLNVAFICVCFGAFLWIVFRHGI